MGEAGLPRLEVGRGTFCEHRRAGLVQQFVEMARRLRERPEAVPAVEFVKDLLKVQPLRVHDDALHEVADENDLIFKAVFFFKFVFFLMQYLKERGSDVAAAGQCDVIYHYSPSII